MQHWLLFKIKQLFLLNITMNLIKHRDRICNDLITQGWVLLDDFFEPELIQLLAHECQLQHQLGLLNEAGIGREQQHQVEKSIRGDQIRWLEPGMADCVDVYLTHLEKLRKFFNKQLFLGLEDTENHFAYYPKGAFYQKHVDCFHQSDSRVISSVLYLNPDWQPKHGGELRLHIEDLREDIEPIANRFVMFISAKILHEVLPTTVERMSLTGWFRRNN
jgi:SM-20-related protein